MADIYYYWSRGLPRCISVRKSRPAMSSETKVEWRTNSAVCFQLISRGLVIPFDELNRVQGASVDVDQGFFEPVT